MYNEIVNIIEKISVYEVVNSIIPGAIYVVAVEKLTDVQILAHNNLLTNIVLIYFFGLIASRIGSLVIDPLLKVKLPVFNKSFLNLAPYPDYIKAEETGRARVRYLQMVSNMYRCLTATGLCILLTVIGVVFCPFLKAYGIGYNTIKIVACILLFLLFVFSYKKQANYVRQRVEYIIKTDTNNDMEKKE